MGEELRTDIRLSVREGVPQWLMALGCGKCYKSKGVGTESFVGVRVRETRGVVRLRVWGGIVTRLRVFN